MNINSALSKKQIYATAIVLIAEIITVTVPVSILGSKFNFPEILRQPASNAFALFKQNEKFIIE
jgi:hypothetical protein